MIVEDCSERFDDSKPQQKRACLMTQSHQCFPRFRRNLTRRTVSFCDAPPNRITPSRVQVATRRWIHGAQLGQPPPASIMQLSSREGAPAPARPHGHRHPRRRRCGPAGQRRPAWCRCRRSSRARRHPAVRHFLMPSRRFSTGRRTVSKIVPRSLVKLSHPLH